MITQPLRASYHEHRAQQRPIVEKLQELTRQSKELRVRGQSAKAASIDLKIKRLKRELGIKAKTKPLTPLERKRKKAELKARLKKT